jgi:DNA-binding XRE family transcriptional regulator
MGYNFSLSANKLQSLSSAQSKFPLCEAFLMESYPHEEFGQRFTSLVEGMDVGHGKKTLKRVATLLKVSTTTVHDWMKGKKLPGMDSAIRLAMFFNVCVEWLLTGRGPKAPGPSDDGGNGSHIDLSALPPGARAAFEEAFRALSHGSDSKKEDVG